MFIINVLKIHNYSFSLITDIFEINIIKNVYQLCVILLVYHLMVRTWSLVFMLKKNNSPILKLYVMKRDAILAHINLYTITKSNFHQFNVFCCCWNTDVNVVNTLVVLCWLNNGYAKRDHNILPISNSILYDALQMLLAVINIRVTQWLVPSLDGIVWWVSLWFASFLNSISTHRYSNYRPLR